MNIKEIQSAMMLGRDRATERFAQWQIEFYAPIGERMERDLMMSLSPEQHQMLQDAAPEAYESVMKRVAKRR